MTIEIEKLSNLDPLWVSYSKELIQDPHNFHKWTQLINYTENLNGGIVKNSSSMDKYLLCMTYENLLLQFPCLEKYWCDFAQWYFRMGETENCVKTYIKLLTVLPNSLLIWILYLKFILFYKSGDLKFLLKEFERGRIAIGLHYYSDKFYDLYLSFLSNSNQDLKYYNLLRRILEIPLYNYAKYFHKWFQLIENTNLENVLYIINDNDLKSRYQFSSDELKNNNKVLQDLKTKLKKLFIDLYITTQYHSYQFYQFEKNLIHQFYTPSQIGKIPTNHELQSWINYLTYLETLLLSHSNTKDKLNYQIQLHYINFNYERCLIINSHHKQFWLKFINFQISINNLSKAIELAIRSLKVPDNNDEVELNNKLIDLYLLTGDCLKAHGVLLMLYKYYPNDLSVFVKLLICERLLHANENNLAERLISLVLKKISSIDLQKQNDEFQEFNMIFREIQDFKILSIPNLKDFITSYKDTNDSVIYWEILLKFIHTHYNDEFQQFWIIALDKCQNVDRLQKKFANLVKETDTSKKKDWIDMF